MYKIIIFLLFTLTLHRVQSQTCEWAVQYHKYYKTEGVCVQTDKNKNVYVAGNYSTNNHHVVPTIGLYLKKYNAEGVLLWSQTYDSMGVNDMGIDSKSNLYLSLRAWPNVKFDNIITSDYQSLYCKLDSMGNFLSTTLINSPNVGNISITIDLQDEIYLCGMFKDTLIFPCITLQNPADPGCYGLFIAKYNSNNQCLWAKQTKGGAITKYPTALSFDEDGNFLVFGQNSGSVSFDVNNTILAQGGANTFIAKYTKDGNVLWVKNFGSATVGGNEELKSVTCDKYGNVLASGAYDSDLSIDGFYLPDNGTYFPKPFFAKLDKNGLCTSVTSDNSIYKIINNKYYILGGVNTSGTYNNVNLQPGFYIMRCDTNWKGLWALQPPIFGSTFTDDDAGNLYFTGSFSGTVDFGNGKILTGDKDMFAAKYSAPKQVGIKNILENRIKKIDIYPNPTNGIITFKSSSDLSANSGAEIRIENFIGQLLYTKKINTNVYGLNETIDLSNYPKGIYFVQINAGSAVETRKIILE